MRETTNPLPSIHGEPANLPMTYEFDDGLNEDELALDDVSQLKDLNVLLGQSVFFKLW